MIGREESFDVGWASESRAKDVDRPNIFALLDEVVYGPGRVGAIFDFYFVGTENLNLLGRLHLSECAI